MSDPASELEYQNFRSSAKAADGTSPGWGAVGQGLGDAVTGASTAPGNPAFTKGLQVGAQTIDALAQARQRIIDQQQNHTAATQLRDPQFQQLLGLKPEEGEYAATLAEKGAPPQQVTEFLKGQLDIRNRQTLGDAAAPVAARHAAAYSLSPASATPHEFGPAGSSFDPLGNNGSGEATVSPQQSEMNASTIQKNQETGAAATSNAQSHAQTANAAGTTPKLVPGNKWVADPQDPTGVQHDATGKPVQAPDLNANKGEGAIGERYTRRVVNSANELAKETAILGKIGFDSSTGAQVNGSHGGLLGTTIENAGRAFSSEQSQQYKSSMAGISNQLGSLELAGGVPPGTYTKQLDNAIQNAPADTINTRLQHAALIRQIAEVAAESASENAKMSDSAKQGIYKAVATIQKNIPFQASEVQDFRHSGKPGQTFQQFLDSNPRAATEHYGSDAPAAGPAAPAAPAGGKPAGYDPLNLLGGK